MARGKASADMSFENVPEDDDLLESMQGLNITTGMDYGSQLKEVVRKLGLKPKYHTREDNFFGPEWDTPKMIPVNSIKERFEDLAQIHIDARYAIGDDSPEKLLKPLFDQKFHQLTNRQFVLALLAPVMKENCLVLRFDDLLSLNLQPPKEAKNVVKKWRPSFVIYSEYNNQPIPLGVVQVTSGGNVNMKAVYQCMIYMFVLRTKARHSLFGIVSDGRHHVLISLDTYGTFHLEGNADRQTAVRRTASTWERLRYIALMINTL